MCHHLFFPVSIQKCQFVTGCHFERSKSKNDTRSEFLNEHYLYLGSCGKVKSPLTPLFQSGESTLVCSSPLRKRGVRGNFWVSYGNVWPLRHIIIAITLILLFSFNTVWASETFNLFGKPQTVEPIPITLKLSGQTTWNEQGGGEAIVDLDMINTGQDSRRGELRLLILAINGRIDFSAVIMKVLKRPVSTKNSEQKDTYTGFLVEEGIMLGQESQAWRFQIILPTDSRKPNMALQLFALYQGKKSSGERWVTRDTLLLSQPNQ